MGSSPKTQKNQASPYHLRNPSQRSGPQATFDTAMEVADEVDSLEFDMKVFTDVEIDTGIASRSIAGEDTVP